MDKPNRKKKQTQNRGVSITSEELQAAEEHASEGTNMSTAFPSLYNVRNQLQNAIDVMGPATPHFLYASSSHDADNEESLYSSTSIFSSVVQIKKPDKTKDQAISTREYESPRDFSEISTNAESEVLTVVHDFPQRPPLVHDFSRENPPQPIRVPAVLPPAVLCMNPSCVCSHSVTFQPVQPNYEDQACYYNNANKEKKRKFSDLFGKFTKTHRMHRRMEAQPTELYKINIMQPRKDGSPPRRFVFDLIDEVPKPTVNSVGTNTQQCHCSTKTNAQVKAPRRKSSCTNNDICTAHASHYSGIIVNQNAPRETYGLQNTAYYNNLEHNSKLSYKTDQSTARVDVYYFDHGNAAYYRTTDSPPLIMTEIVAEKTENYATKFWAELFGTLYIVFAFLTSFILQFLRFILHSIVRPLTIGILQLMSDYFFKPFLAVIFNAIVQPPLIFIYNITTSLRDLCDPIAEGFGYFLREIAVLCKSIRLFEIRQEKYYGEENKDTNESGSSNKQSCKSEST